MLELKHIAKTYKNGVNALYNINLKIDQGEFVYIIGPTGSGKSTLIKLLDGEEIPTKGKVEVTGINVGKLKHSKVPLYRRNIGVVFQDFRLLERKTVFENIAFALEVINVPKEKIRKRVREVMNLVGLDDKGNSFPQELSGGQQQRVLIARALCATSSLLILDEPITGLDPTAIQEFYTMIRRLNREDKVAILMVSHDLRNAVEEANKILHLQKRVLFYGPAHDYMNSQAAGHFFHEKEQGRCKPTAGCHTVKLHMHKEDKS